MEEIKNMFKKAREAQKKYATFTQEQVDKLFYEVAKFANTKRIDLAELAVNETQRGILEDKVTKNHFAAEMIYNKYKNAKTVGVINEDEAAGYKEIAEPVGVIAAIIPVTNPTSTTIFKVLMAIKTRNGIIVCPHPQAKSSTAATVKMLSEVATKHGAPEGLIQVIEEPSMDGTTLAMTEADYILATGGGGLVKAAYSSGTPAIGVGAGNCPSIITSSADLDMAVTSIIQSNVFDNGMVCATENSVIVEASIYEKAKKLFEERGGYIVSNPADIKKVENGMFKEGNYGLLHPFPVGKKPEQLGEHFGIKVPAGTKLMLVEAKGTKYEDPLAHEKLSTYVSLYKAKDFNQALDMAEDLLTMGEGHTASLHINESEKEAISKWQSRLKAGRLLINTPSSLGGVGDLYNFSLLPSLTLGCGSWGGNSFMGQVGPFQLLNIKRVATRRENTLWMKIPKTYFQEGCTPEALKDLVDDGVKKVLVVSDEIIWKFYGSKIEESLRNLKLDYKVFTDVQPNPMLTDVEKGLVIANSYKPEAIIGFGGGSPIDAGKLIWFYYENPGADFRDLAMTFADIRKRIVKFPKTGTKAQFVAIPTTAGTGSEVTPFSVISTTENGEHKKYPLADYALTPHMAIVDAQFQMTMPRSVTAVSGLDALSHALEAYASILATEFTDPLSMQAIKMVFEFLPRAVKDGANDKEARIAMAHASCIAGMAFSNAFLGIVHSLSHKLGAGFDVPHGHANAIVLPYVIKYNSRVNEGKQALFAQYKTPIAKQRYAEVARAIGCTGANDDILVDKLIDKVVDLVKECGLATDIKSAIKASEEEFMKEVPTLARLAFDDQCTGANPRYPLIKDIEELYKNAYFGKDAKTQKL